MKSQKVAKLTLLTVSLALFLVTASGGLFVGKSQMINVAIKGYDTVSYFTAGKAVKGSELYPFPWHGMVWHFSSKENMELFANSPEKYAPQYDGYCAWAMSEKRKALTNPEVWKIVSGKLYLNCSVEAFKKWSRDIPGNIKKADANWVTFSGSNE